MPAENASTGYRLAKDAMSSKLLLHSILIVDNQLASAWVDYIASESCHPYLYQHLCCLLLVKWSMVLDNV